MIIPDKHKWSRWVLGIGAVVLMALLYVFQRKWLWFENIPVEGQWRYLPFIVNRSLRLLLNDSFCLVLFLAIFNRTQEVKLASLVFLVEFLVVLPMYLVLKLSMEGDSEISSPLLSFIHRLIVNPLLMMILLVGLWYQKHRMNVAQQSG